jgi:crotonobetainyl-CoA:carnitine CoA-transferase CaiB-like acyl-CoA transferase
VSGSGALVGIRVLDLTQFLAGPYGTQILGDLGAEVIKLEAPAGDWSRTLPPNFVGPDSCYYLSINRNKKSVVVDMKVPEGLALVRRLSAASDIVMENFRPGVLARLGLDYAAVSKESPGVIWCSISGFGQDGPDRDRPAYDMIVQALSGGMGITGEPGRPAVRAGIPIGDLSAGMFAVIGALAALEERRRSGKGQIVDVSMLDCQVSMLTYQAAYHLHSGRNPGRQGSGHDSIPTYRGFECANGTGLVITANTEKMWQSLTEVLGLPELAKDPRFLTNDKRYASRTELWPLLEVAFKKREARDWVPLLLAAAIPVGEINSLSDALGNPQVRQRDMVLSLDSGDGRQVRVVGDPVKLSRSRRGAHRYPPRLGEDTRDILVSSLGFSDAEVDGLIAAGAVKEAG